MIRRLILISLLILVTVGASFAYEDQPDIGKGEGYWSNNGVAVVKVYNTNGDPTAPCIRNVSPQAIHDIVVAVGDVDKNGDLEYTGVARFPVTLPPNAVWHFREQMPEVLYDKVLSVSVDGKDLQLLPEQPTAGK